jgi:hypothetical protein
MLFMSIYRVLALKRMLTIAAHVQCSKAGGGKSFGKLTKFAVKIQLNWDLFLKFSNTEHG